MTLYDILGVSRDATTEEIHAAYRRLAMSAHPDVGGDVDIFARLKLAHDILVDPDRRAHYNVTGEIKPIEADNEMAAMLTVITGAFDDACSAAMQAQEDVTKIDMLQRMRAAITKRIGEIQKQRVSALNEAITFLGLMIGRFSSTTGPNYLDDLIRQKQEAAKQFAERAAGDIARLEKASLFLQAYRYRSDPVMAISMVDRHWQTATATMSAREFEAQLMGRQQTS